MCVSAFQPTAWAKQAPGELKHILSYMVTLEDQQNPSFSISTFFSVYLLWPWGNMGVPIAVWGCTLFLKGGFGTEVVPCCFLVMGARETALCGRRMLCQRAAKRRFWEGAAELVHSRSWSRSWELAGALGCPGVDCGTAACAMGLSTLGSVTVAECTELDQGPFQPEPFQESMIYNSLDTSSESQELQESGSPAQQGVVLGFLLILNCCRQISYEGLSVVQICTRN